MNLLLGVHSTVAKGLPVVLRLDTILETCYGGDVTKMLLALGRIRGGTCAKGGKNNSSAAARTAGTFQSLCSVCVQI